MHRAIDKPLFDGDVVDSLIDSVSASKVSGVLATGNIPSLDASKVTSGTLALARIPSIDSSRVPSLDASKITSGQFSTARIPGFTCSNAANGYQWILGGILLQWWTFTSSNGDYADTYYPVTFPNGVYIVNGERAAIDANQNLGIVTVYADRVYVNPGASGTYYCFAIGH